jgi:hypothetical protein
MSHKTHFWLLMYLLALVISIALLIRAWSQLSAVLFYLGLGLALLSVLGLLYVMVRIWLDLRHRMLDARVREQQLLIEQERHQLEMEQEAARLAMEYQERERQAELAYRQFELQQHLALTRVQPTEHGYAAILDDNVAFTQIPYQGKPALLVGPRTERKNADEGRLTAEDLSPLALPLPPTLDFAEVLRTWRPSPEEIFLFYTANGPIYEAMEQTCHIGLAGATGGGKTNCFRLILAQFLACGADLYLANPNFAPIKLNGRTIEDWRPIVGAMRHAVAWQIEDIQRLITNANRRLDQRREQQQVSPLRGRDIYLALGEWPAIQSRWKDAAKPVAQLLREARQYGIHVVSEFQDALVSTLGISSGVRESFRNAYYFGGDANTARVLLDLQGKGPLDETGLGRLGASLFRANSQPAVRGRMPFLSNQALYMLLGTPNNPLPDRLPEGADPKEFFADHGIAVEAFSGELEESQMQAQSRTVYMMPGSAGVVDATGNERRTGPLTPDVRRLRHDGEQIHTLSSARTNAQGDGQEGAPDDENQSDMSAHKTGMHRPVDRAHPTGIARTSSYPRMSPLQEELFVTAYRLTGNIDESLKKAGVNTRYRDHARLIIQQRNLKKEG